MAKGPHLSISYSNFRIPKANRILKQTKEYGRGHLSFREIKIRIVLDFFSEIMQISGEKSEIFKC